MFNLTAIEAKIGVFLLIVLMSFGSGFYVKGKLDTSAKVKAEIQIANQSAKNVQQSEKQDAQIRTATRTNDAQIATDRTLIAKHLSEQRKYAKKQKSKEDSSNVQQPQFQVGLNCNDNWTLDNYTFGLLNAARTGASYSAATSSNGEGFASSGVTEAQFIDNDLEIVGMYNDLAKRHNALIDYVQELIKAQTK